jgi:NAD-dependent deacetylase
MQVASMRAFQRRPRAFYDWMRPLARTLYEAEPNPGHVALATLEAQGYLEAVITQNIDALHQRAGSSEVLEVHGHLRLATCIDCYRVQPGESLMDAFLASGTVPRCPECGGIMKPNVVLYGEQLPVEVVNAAMSHVHAADLMLIAGSSLEVHPVSQLPMRVHRHGGRLIVVNLTPTYADDVADVVIRGDVADVLPRIARACQSRTG